MNSHQRDVSITRRHREWPLGTKVIVNMTGLQARVKPGTDPRGMLAGPRALHGRVVRHIRGKDQACDIEFAVPIDIGNANGLRYCHVLSLSRLKATP